jgi:DNA modification methylase
MLEINKIYNMDCIEGFKLLEDNCIDLQLEKDSRGLYFNFDPKILMIFDENDITYYYRYDRYTYEELEDNLVKLVKNHFN